MIAIPSWLIIGGITFTVAFWLNQLSPADRSWFFGLRRPRWLTFEGLIPFIWIFIFLCIIGSASLVWDFNPWSRRAWFLMGRYLILVLLILAYTPVMCKFRSLTVGTIIGGVGFLFGLWLAIMVLPVSGWAFVLLIPYLLWSPIGTYVTWAMITLNPGSR
jgi:tryptophan-rich sensory protein